MMTDEFEMSRDSGGPIDTLAHCFAAFGWQADRQGEDELVASVQGSWATYEMRAVCRDEDKVLQFLAFPDIRVGPEQRAAIYETIGLVNEQLWVGHFELWNGTGLIVYRHAVLLDAASELTMSLDQAETVIETALEECERFYPVFQFVLWGGKSPQEAIAASMIETAGEA
jgi:hypothetical protein